MLVVCGLCLLVAVIGTFVVIFRRCDGDLLLMWKEKFGLNVDSLSGQIVWITGASSGIGECLAYRLAQAGCKLVLSARRLEELERVKTTCLQIGKGKVGCDDILVLPLDIVKFESHKSAVNQVMDKFKQIDILINNAGTAQRAKWHEVDLEVDRQMFDLNVFGPVSLTQLVLPHMMARGKGHLVVTSTLAGKIGVPFSRSYNGSKFAINGYFECLRSELGQQNISVTVLCPGPVFSNIFLHSFTNVADERLGKQMNPTDKRMPTDRCAHLSCLAIANRLSEVWISEHPFLFITYLAQYAPDTGRWILKKYGTTTLMKAREG